MKRILVASALILGLAACNRDKAGGGTVDPVLPNAYNPEASATESTDTRVPYQGDWAWVAKLPDGSYQRGVLSINERGQPTNEAKNGGRGTNALCSDASCTSTSGPDFGLLLSAVSNGGAQLVAILGDSAGDGNRVTMTDSDGKVTLNDKGRPVISGPGTFTGTEGVRVAFVQVDTTADMNYGTVLADVLAQAQTAADAVTVQQVQSLPKLDVQSILK